jgi:hypothetical protein
MISDFRFKFFYFFLFFTVIIPYLSYIFPFLPNKFLEFNLTGWAWIIMLFITIFSFFGGGKYTFPIIYWLPWSLYLIIYLILQFSFLGFQLTLQYLLPLMVASVASSFQYDLSRYKFLFKWLLRVSGLILAMYIWGIIFREGDIPAIATSPMFLSILACLLAGMFFILKKKRYIAYYLILFLVPFLSVTRMGIAVFISLIVFHFANKNLKSKVLGVSIGILLVIVVFNSDSFQQKTFIGGEGAYSDLSLNYYENQKIKTTGRTTLKLALESGLQESPVWGNGPRSELKVLLQSTGNTIMESHNDFLAVRYNYGYVGLFLFLSGMLSTFILVWRFSKRADNNIKWILESSTLTLFIGFFLFMYSDNILKYTIFFPNQFFAMVGIIFSINKFHVNIPKQKGNTNPYLHN